MMPLRHRLTFAFILIAAGGGYGQVDSLKEPKEYVLGEVRIFSPEPSFVVRGGREWIPDSLSIANAQMGNLSDLFREIPSLSSKRYAPGGLSTPSLRGTGAGHTQVYWEGLPLNSPMLGQQDIALGAGGLFERVVLRYGGASLQEGSGGLGGSMNLKSVRNPETHPAIGVRLREQFGSFRSNSSQLEFTAGTPGFSSITKLYLNTARNDFTFRNLGLPQSPVQRLKNAGILQYGGLQEFRYSPRGHDFFVRWWMLSSDRKLPPSMLSPSAGEEQTDQAIRSMLQWNRVHRKYRLETKAGWLHESMRYLNAMARIDAPSSFDRYLIQSDIERVPSTLRLAWKGAGIRYLHDQAASEGYTDHARQALASGYAKGEWRFLDRGFFTVLVREEWGNDRFSPLLGYLGTSCQTRIDGLSMRAHVARNYRNPSLNDLHWNPGGNPGLLPELSQAAEAAVIFSQGEQSVFQDGGFQRRGSIHAEIGGYYSHVRDWILWVPVSGALWRPENVQQVTAMGLEAIVRQSGVCGRIRYSIQANHTFASTQRQDGHQLIYVPRHNGSFRLGLEWKAWSLQYFQDWNSRRYTVADNSAFIPGFSTVDVSVGWQPQFSVRDSEIQGAGGLSPSRPHRLRFQAGIRNLANAQYQTVAWRPMPGRSIFVRLDWAFLSGPVRPQI
jgi:iron complex outermembrane receptor protein